MIRTAIVGAMAASLFVSVAPTAQAQSLGSLGNVFNCSNRGSQQTPGALVGGVLGGLAGAGVAKNDTVGALLGAAVGAGVGSWVGCRMGGQDRASLEDATLRALNEGRNTDWNNPQTGASARINIYADTTTYGSAYGGGGYATPRYGDRMGYGQVRLGQRISAASSYLTTAPSYTALNQVYIRTAPRTNAPTNGSLRRGEQFQALARVEGSNWILVGRGGEGIGYVPETSARAITETVTYAPYVEPISRQSIRLNTGVGWAAGYETAPTLFSVNSNANLRAGPMTGARSLGMVYRGDEVEAIAKVQGQPWILVGRGGYGVGYVHQSMLTPLEVGAGYGPGSGYPASSAGAGYTQASSSCRIVEQIVTTPGYQSQTQTQRYRACRDASGRWNLTAT